MSFSLGYNCGGGNPNCTMSGFIFNEEYIKTKFGNEVRDRLLDIEESEKLIEEFSDVDTTDFESAALKEIFRVEETPYCPWQIGEAFSGIFITEERNVRFWSYTIRDLKNPKARAHF